MSGLTDREWVALKGASDAVRSGNKRPLRDEPPLRDGRLVVEGIVWRFRNGTKRRSVPERFGPWWRAAQLHIRWSRTGAWQRAFEHPRDQGRADLAEVFPDGTSTRARQKATGAKGGSEGGEVRPRAWTLAGWLWHQGRSPVRCQGLGAGVGAGLALAFDVPWCLASELRAAPALPANVRAIGPIGRVVCNRAHSSGSWRRMIEVTIKETGAKLCVPANRGHPSAPYDRAAHKRRLKVENL